MAGRYYLLDTSAYLAILFGEPGGARVSREVSGAELVSSVLLILEVERNIVRSAKEGRLPAGRLHAARAQFARDLDQLAIRDLSMALCSPLAMPAVSMPASLDLAHPQTALWFHRQKPLTRFVSLDADQNQAAQELGLPV